MNEIESGDFMWIEFEIVEYVVDPLQVIVLFEFLVWLMCYHVMLLKLDSSTSLQNSFHITMFHI